LETEKSHKSDNYISYDSTNKRLKCRPQNFPTAIDSTNPWKNYMPVKEDRHIVEFEDGDDISKKELISMVDFSARIPNISQNILLILEVAFHSSNAYYYKKRDNPDY
jgi:hypothetical protein